MKTPASRPGWKERIFSILLAGLFVVYIFPASLSVPYFNYQYARDNGFIQWLWFGETVATFKGMAWPYFMWAQLHSPASDNTLLMLAEQGDPEAQNKLGFAYDTGQGVPQDHGEAAKWYRKAADQGNASAEYNLGSIYVTGEGVAQNYAEALKWFRKAADQGNTSAEYDLGSMYRDGRGVPQDHVEALKWFYKAADQGLAEAENNLGGMYDTGQGVPQDAAQAAEWYRKAADHGSALAKFNLAICYATGQGIPQDFVQAYEWFNLAARGFPSSDTEHRTKAIAARDLLASKMTSAQLAEAQKLTSEWKAK